MAQQPARLRRVAILTGTEGVLSRPSVSAFTDALQQLGWSEGRNLEVRFLPGEASAEITRRNAAEAAAWQPDAILASGAAVIPVIRAARSVPIVFVSVPDPVGSGIVDDLARPGGNVTGFMLFEYGLGGKWLELLKEIAPGTRRAAILRDANSTSGVGQFAAIQSAAPSLGIEVTAIGISETADMEPPIANFARAGNGGLIVTLSALALVRRERIARLAAEQKLPAAYPARDFVVSGGLVSYGADFTDQFRRAASYVDRILKGANPGDLPVQAPVKYQLSINMKAAQALGLKVSPTLLGRADEVIE